jgi:diguanylate cyclase (GGDEF)-like protein
MRAQGQSVVISVDYNTLFLLTVDIEAMLGLLLLFVWVQNLRLSAVAWWGAAHLVRAGSIVLYGLYGSVPSLISIDLANALLFTSYALTWNGARVFDRRKPLVGSLFAGATLWALACLLPGFTGAPDFQALLSGLVIASFIWLTAYEFWKGREEPLVSRWPAILILFMYGVVFLMHTPLSALLPSDERQELLSSAWLTVLSTEALLAAISTAFVFVAMAKERMELGYKRAAMKDPLTDLLNRNAFVEEAMQLTLLQIKRDRPVAVFMIDLDGFKEINDRFGHALGDKVLRVFAETVRTSLRSSDLIGRLGGEEFAVVIADACRDNAFRVADRVRRAFAEAAATVDGAPVNATASFGVSIIQDPNDNIMSLLTQADQALYRAKALGRNRVVLTELKLPEPEPEHEKAEDVGTDGARVAA